MCGWNPWNKVYIDDNQNHDTDDDAADVHEDVYFGVQLLLNIEKSFSQLF